MREDHLIDAPEHYVYRLRAGAQNVTLGGWALALCIVLSMVELPRYHTAPIARTTMVVTLLGVMLASLLLWMKGWWRLTDARVEALPARGVMVSGMLTRTGLALGACGAGAWCLLACLRALSSDVDRTLASLLLHTQPSLVPLATTALLLGAWIASQHAAYTLRERTAPARPGLFALPFTLATLPVGLVTLPNAMQHPTLLAFLTMAIALLLAFHGAQGAILRHRIGRVLRERRRAEVLASREPDRR